MSSPPAASPDADLRRRLRHLTIADERRLRRQLDRARSQRDPARRQAAIERLASQVADAERRVEARRAAVPPVTYPAELPVSAARDELLRTLREHQVVVVAGETGSGKTTQLPKLLLELGYGVRGTIGHTQPRRLAARTVAGRIADELGVELGEQVGFQVRFHDQVGERTLVKLMTDGILLAEVHHDPLLSAYDAIVVDEAHERSLNIDFLLGYLARLLPRRRDLKVVITSATIDPQRFAEHFGGASTPERGAPPRPPVVEVSGRTYDVQVRYRPLVDPDADGGGADRDQVEAICDAVVELAHEGPGDVLVFLSGEREIRDAADALRELGLRDTEVLPLYARLPTAEQQRVFAPHTGRRIVLATNVAETSLTVPGIRYVVDPGTARISRYSHRTKVQRLPIEPISQASAVQRAGRCGRVADGIAIRLYSEEDFAGRPAFTEPEILRTDLAAVILRMAALDLGDVEAFPFLDPPDRRSVRAAFGLLHELGAITADDATVPPVLTRVGRTMAQLPVDPRLARMLVEADRNACLRELLVIAAGLTVQDPRERPTEHQGQADELHARFTDERSDFLALLNLWEYVREQQRALTSSAFRRRLRGEHLHHQRIREWQDLHTQLRSIATALGLERNDTPAEADAVHRSLLAGLLSNVGTKEPDVREYRGARGTRFALWPGSALARKPPAWVVCAEIVETSRLWGRTAGGISPSWVEDAAPHVVQRSYSEPRWSRKRAGVVADERVTLYGLTLVAGRVVPYGRIDPVVSRELFIRHAVVAGEWDARHAFLDANRRLLRELDNLEHRLRRRDVVIDDETLVSLYDDLIPPQVVSGRHFDAWWKRTRATQPELLTFTRAELLATAADAPSPDDHPDVWRQAGLRLPLAYRFDPGAEDDGVTVEVPLGVLHRVRPTGFDWQVPGLRAELVVALLRSLPKDLRRELVPIPDVAGQLLAGLPPDPPGAVRLVDALAAQLRRTRDVVVPPSAWDWRRVPDHLRMGFRVVDHGRSIVFGKDLLALQQRLLGRVRRAVADAAAGVERTGVRAWSFGDLPRTVQVSRDGMAVTGYPSLVDEGDQVSVRVLLSPEAQRSAMWTGTRRLLLLALPPPVRAVAGRLTTAEKLAVARSPHGSVGALLEDCTAAAVDDLLDRHGGPVWDGDAFVVLRSAVARDLDDLVLDVVRAVVGVLAATHDVDGQLADAPAPVAEEVRRWLTQLVGPGFVSATGRERLPDLVRYLTAASRRLERARQDPAKDRALAGRIAAVEAEVAAAATHLDPRALRDVRWMVEELRVSVFAQQLGTRTPISEQRILRRLDDLAAPRV